MSRHSMVLNNITCIDHAFIDICGETPKLLGGSVHISLVVEGNVIGDEQVVVDFSTFKKDVKQYIDGPTGFDHKVWIPIIENNDSIDITVRDGGNDRVSVKCDAFFFDVPESACSLFYFDENESFDYSNYLDVIANNVWDFLNAKYPELDIVVGVHFTEDFASIKTDESAWSYRFRYAHGLKNSTSLGCQNIVHGHLSEIVLHKKDGYPAKLLECLSRFDDCYFVLEENVVGVTGNLVYVEYNSARGNWQLLLNKDLQNVFILPHETTIEHLAKFIYDYIIEVCDEGVEYCYVSEGLDKGSIVTNMPSISPDGTKVGVEYIRADKDVISWG